MAKKRIKNPNAVIRKKKKPLTKKQRRARSLKGWETRRLLAGLQATSKTLGKINKKEREIEELRREFLDDRDRMNRKTAELEELVRMLNLKLDYEKKAKEQLDFDLQFADFVRGEPLEFLHRDGTVAINPTILRHLDITDSLLDRLGIAYKMGPDEFDNEARRISLEQDVELREIYTLWESP